MKKNYLLLLFIFFFVTEGFPQQDPYLDSIYKESKAKLDKYDYKNAIEKLIFLNEEAKKKGNIEFRYHAQNLLGSSYMDLQDTLRYKKHYERALELAEEIQNDTLLLWAYNNMGQHFF